MTDVVWETGPECPDNVYLGAMLHRLRQERGEAVGDLAARLGISESYVRMVERGERTPAQDLLVIWLGCFTEVHLGGDLANRPVHLRFAAYGNRYGVICTSRIRQRGRGRRLDHGLTPIYGGESTVAELVAFVHERACSTDAQTHDPYCNTLRLLVEDWQLLTALERERTWRSARGDDA